MAVRFVRWSRSKYNATPTMIDGIRFASKKEADFYNVLKVYKRAGDVCFFLRQVPFDCGGGVRYVLDFMVFYKTGEVKFIDVKGMRTRTYINKKKQVEVSYDINIEEV